MTKPISDGGAHLADMTQALPASDQRGAALGMVESMRLAPVNEEDLAGFDVDSSGRPLEVAPIDSNAQAGAGFEIPKKKNRRNLKAFIITFLILACVLGGVYVGVAMMFQSQFLPNTTIGEFDVSMKKDAEVAEMLSTIPEDYTLNVSGGDFKLDATGEDVGMKIDAEGIVAAMHEDLNPWYWPWYILEQSHDESDLIATTYDKDKCNAFVKAAVNTYNKKAEAPTNAYVTFDEDEQQFVIIPDELGTQLSPKAVGKVVRKAVAAMDEQAELGEKQLKRAKVRADNKKLVASTETANGLVSAHLKLSINGNVVDEIGSELLSKFVSVSDKYEVKLSEDDLANWVAELAGSYDTIGMTRNYTRADGKQITVSGGAYGWEIDEATLRGQIMDAIKAGGESEIEIPCIDSANVYTGRGERDWGNRYIDVDLSEQHARFYGDDGNIIWESDFISGAADGEHETPQGVWYVIMKESPSKLIGYLPNGKKDYEAEVTYWMPFEGNSVGFHDATWQPGFGGNMYAEGYGSHGCVNLPLDAARSLYDIIQPNDVVVVHS